MLKKLLIAAIAVFAGLAVLNFSLVRVWWKDACCSARRMVPPEVQLKRLNAEINAIDDDIKKNLSTLARMEVQTDKLNDQLKKMRVEKDRLSAKMEELEKNLEGRTEKIAFRGRLADKLDSVTNDYTLLSARIKEQDKLVQEKKKNLETALERITKMRHEKEKLRLLHARLEHQLELVKAKQMESRVIDLDNSAVSRAQQLADDIETYLREKEVETKHLKEFGYETPESRFEKDSKSVDEVLKASKKARQQEQEPVEAVSVDNEQK